MLVIVEVGDVVVGHGWGKTEKGWVYVHRCREGNSMHGVPRYICPAMA